MALEIPFESEYELHTLTMKHLKELFDLELISSEIPLNGFRLDNLAYDRKNNIFVIIEYKNELDLNVFNQVKNYYDLFQNNEKSFMEKSNMKNVDFNNTQVMIIGTEFSKDQIEKDNDFELWKVTLFDNNEAKYENLRTNELKILKVNWDEIKLSEKTLLKYKSDKIIEIYKNFKNSLLEEFDDLDLKFLVDAVSIKSQNEYLCIVTVKNSIKIHYYTENLKDSENKTRDISEITTGGPLSNYELTLNNENIDYAIDLIKQVYDQKVMK